MIAGKRKKTVVVMASVVMLFAAAIALSACSAKNSSTTDGGSKTAGSGSTKWSPEADCSTCHKSEAASVQDATLLAAKHSAKKCADCHDVTALSGLHANVTGPPTQEQATRMRKSARAMGTKEFCLKCHGSLEELAAKTAASTALKDINGTVVNPHAIPSSPKHDSAKVSDCLKCHAIHKASPEVGSACKSCHHADVFQCGTCHEVAQ